MGPQNAKVPFVCLTIWLRRARSCAEKVAEERAKETERPKLLEDAWAKRQQEMKDSARRSWLIAGGTEEEFEREWPQMRTEMLRRRTLEDDANARAAQRRSGVSSL